MKNSEQCDAICFLARACIAGGSGQWLSASPRLFNRLEGDGLTMWPSVVGQRPLVLPAPRAQAVCCFHKDVVYVAQVLE